jgi:hypothetical protein
MLALAQRVWVPRARGLRLEIRLHQCLCYSIIGQERNFMKETKSGEWMGLWETIIPDESTGSRTPRIWAVDMGLEDSMLSLRLLFIGKWTTVLRRNPPFMSQLCYPTLCNSDYIISEIFSGRRHCSWDSTHSTRVKVYSLKSSPFSRLVCVEMRLYLLLLDLCFNGIIRLISSG